LKILFDTHTFLWWIGEPERLSKKLHGLCKDRNNTILLSVVSVWEIQIKRAIGKLRLDESLKDLIEREQLANGLQILPVNLNHVLILDDLSDYHKDPFDRLLIAQSMLEETYLASKDKIFKSYPVKLIW